jgi:hypothetical protein
MGENRIFEKKGKIRNSKYLGIYIFSQKLYKNKIFI